ncbi:MAG: 2-carboxy-1,4-naphthoquinone phytyltransferase [Pseudanabaenaceae cyanobacterium SKYGB_i_bin29]|nr:2-carboxy-1,4-naphthoquinone phytyltransferase [Pseudanabaenaceae cyanobacterium SKYG29]MDW8421602.1 2-carboxy-1,4-naphthoquinone phytyltransferase [Pseudanabaenaceae cyanobacterium SKYGB_i_bin29]
MLTTDRRKLWQAAIKLPMYSVAVMPIGLGSALAWYDKGVFHWQRLVLFLLAAVFLLAWENLCNDVFDAETGVDEHKFHSVVKLTNNKTIVFTIANLFLVLGLLCLGGLVWQQGDITVLTLGLLCCLLGYVYQGPPFRLGYQGVGEILCFLAFAIAVGAAYYSQGQSFSPSLFLPSVINGLTTSLILFCSHFHQVEDDRKAGKLSPIVRLGTKRSAQLIPWFCGLIYGLALVGIGGKMLPWTTIGMLLSLPFAWRLIQVTAKYHDCPPQIQGCKFIAVALHFWSNLGLILGLLFHAL